MALCCCVQADPRVRVGCSCGERHLDSYMCVCGSLVAAACGLCVCGPATVVLQVCMYIMNYIDTHLCAHVSQVLSRMRAALSRVCTKCVWSIHKMGHCAVLQTSAQSIGCGLSSMIYIYGNLLLSTDEDSVTL